MDIHMENNQFKIVFENGKPKVDKEICLGIVCADLEPESKEERYQFHLALEYFKTNFIDFTQQEINKVCANPYAVKRLGGNFDITVLQLCVKKGVPLPVALPSWAGKKIKRTLLHNYVEMINANGDTDQLKFFLEHFHDAMMDFIDQSANISPTLYEGIAKKIFDKEDNKLDFTSTLDILVNKDISIMNYLAKNNPDEFKELLSVKLNEHLNNTATVNLAQYLLFNKQYNSLNEVLNIFSEHKELLLEPVNVKLCLYEKKTPFFEYALKEEKFMAFAPFSLNDNLDAEQKEQMTAAAFTLILYKHDMVHYVRDFKVILSQWHYPIINASTDEQVNRYSASALKGNDDNLEFKKEIDSILLHRELNNGLHQNNTTVRKIKI
jgi:hypothetical protein